MNYTRVTETARLIHTGQCRLSGIVLNDIDAGNILTVYDNTSAAAPIIARFENATGAVIVAEHINFKRVIFKTGIYVTTSAINQDFTVLWQAH